MFKDIEEMPIDEVIKVHLLIGKNVSRLRKKHKISQLKLSEMLGHKSTSLISGAEICYKGQHFSIEHLIKIAYLLDEDLTEFFKPIN